MRWPRVETIGKTGTYVATCTYLYCSRVGLAWPRIAAILQQLSLVSLNCGLIGRCLHAAHRSGWPGKRTPVTAGQCPGVCASQEGATQGGTEGGKERLSRQFIASVLRYVRKLF